MIREILFDSANYNLPLERLNGIRHDTHSRGSRHDDGDDSRDSRRGDNHRRRIHILHHIRGRLQEHWLLPPRRSLQVKNELIRSRLLNGF